MDIKFNTSDSNGKEQWRGMYKLTNTSKVPENGIILENLTHEGYNLAKEIRIAKVRFNIGSSDEKELALASSAFEPATVTDHVSSTDSPPFQFGKYVPVKILKALYQTVQPLYENGYKLQIEQTYMFTHYNNTPAHEPGGVLIAARIFPLVKFQFIDGGKIVDEPKLKNIRFDYRFHLSLDVFLNATSIPDSLFKILGRGPSTAEIEEVKARPNQAGVFRDKEEIPGGLLNLMGKEIRIEEIFEAGEKPLKYEIFGNGLINGIPGDIYEKPKTNPAGDILKDTGGGLSLNPTTWDNIHWWGGFDWTERKKSDQSIKGTAKSILPSTPGAFHAGHLHWRWGFAAGSPTLLDKAKLQGSGIGQGAFGQPQFKGVDVKTLLTGGPLVDPYIPNQTIQFCITNYGYKNDTKSNFKNTFFTNNNPLPKKINEGKNLEFWFSITVNRPEKTEFFSGTLFIHGLYFAHESEFINGKIRPSPSKETIGKSLNQDVKQEWERFPKA